MIFSSFLEYWANTETYFSHFLSILEAKAREYFQGSCHHFLVWATDVEETIQLVLSMELLQYIACQKFGVNTNFVLGLTKDLQMVCK